MREHKYRAFDKNKKEMVKLNAGTKYVIDFRGDIEEYRPALTNASFPTKTHTAYFINRSDRFILMQYTGLKDKSGKEIYEGDIVANNPRVSIVPGHGKLDSAVIVELKNIDGSDDMGVDCIGYPLYWEEFEVIGNIYEKE